MLWLCNILNNFVGQWKDLLDEVENRPLEYFVFLAVLLIGMGAIYFDVAGKSFAIFIVGWTTAFFVYKRAKAVEQQLQATEKSGANERFDRLCARLDGNGETGQIGGLIGLDNLAREQRESYKKEVFVVVCAFLRGKSMHERVTQYAINTFFKIQKDDNKRYFYEEMEPDLAGANLKKINLKGVQLPNAVLDEVDFSEAQFSSESNFQNASLKKSQMHNVEEICGNFTGCIFQKAIFSGSFFVDGAILDNANFINATVFDFNLERAQSMKKTILPLEAYNAIKAGEYSDKHLDILEEKNHHDKNHHQ